MTSARRAFAGLVIVASLSCLARGHAIVQPERVSPGSFEKFVLRVPTEKPIPTTQVRLLIPDKLQVFSLGGKIGWHYELEKDKSGRLESITWFGGIVPAGEFIDFEFIGRAPKEAGTVVWKAYQTYQDGTVVAWIGPPESAEPASITRIEPAVHTDTPPAWAMWSTFAMALIALSLSAYCLLRFSLLSR